jgi:predicted PurR-regulated permease PerM
VSDTNNPQTGRYDFDRVFRLALTAAGIVGLFWLIYLLSDVLLPFIVALLLAYLINPITTSIERRVKRRTLAVLLTVGLLSVLGGLIVVVLVPIVAGEIGRFESAVAQIRDEGSALAKRLNEALSDPRDRRLAWLVERLRAFLVSEDFNSMLAQAVQAMVPTARGVLAGAMRTIFILVGVVLVLVYLVFLLIDYRLIARTWKDYLPPLWRQPILEFLGEFEAAMGRYFRKQFVVAMITGVLFALGFYLIGLPLAVLFGLLIGLLNMVPYLQAVAIVPAAALAVVRAVELQSSIAASFLLVALVFVLAQLIQDVVLVPRIMGKAFGLRPVVIMLSVFIWGRLLGFVGLVLAIPLTCLGLAYYRRFVLKNVASAPVDSPGAASPASASGGG